MSFVCLFVVIPLLFCVSMVCCLCVLCDCVVLFCVCLCFCGFGGLVCYRCVSCVVMFGVCFVCFESFFVCVSVCVVVFSL